MAGKITDYPTTTSLIDEDLFDTSKWDGVSAFTSTSVKWEDILKELQTQLTFNNIYNNNGTLAGNRTVSMGVNDLTFGSTGDANLLKFETTNDRIGIGVAAPSVKLEVAGDSKINGTFKTQSSSAVPVNLYKEGVGNNMIQLSMQNDTSAEYQYTQIGGKITDDTTGSEEGSFLVQLSNNGAIDSLGEHQFLVDGLTRFPKSINGGIFRESNSGGFRWSLNLRNSANVIEPYAALATEVIDNTNGSEDGVLKFYARSNGVNFNSSNHQAILTGTGFGIGTAAPTEKLEVVGNALVNGAIEIKGTTNYTALTFDNTAANRNNNILFNDAGVTVGQIHYDLFGSGAFGDGFKIYAKTPLVTDAETMVWDSNDNVHIPNGSFFVGLSAPGLVEASAIIQANSTTKGFLPPRMTTTQRNAITTPATGLTIYNTTTNKLNFYNSSAWEAVTSV
jgi:hypothetical protein